MAAAISLKGIEAPYQRHQFDRMTADGLAAIREGRIAAESVPGDGGRWGLSVVFTPMGHLRDQLDALTAEAITLGGNEHWRTGSKGSAHVTVRALEPRSSEPLNPVDFEQYVAAVGRAAVDIRSVSFEFVGLAASAGTVMACAHSVDGRANELRHRLQIELGEYGWLENNHFASGRDPIWYATLVNFTGPLENPEHFIDWFSRSRSINLGTAEFGQVELCRWTFQDLRMVPEVIRPIRLGEQSA